MLGRKTGTYLRRRDGAGRVGFQCIIGWAYLFVQPAFDGAILREQSTEAVPYDLAFAGVLAGPYLGFHYISHFIR
jgi:hypothetical protein